MRMTLLGSGGFRRTPRPGCKCRVCEEARELGFQRLGPALFIHDGNVLFDTPEDIATELDMAGIDRLEQIFYTHWHPDHTMGARIVEIMNTGWSEDMSWRLVAKQTTTIHMPSLVHDEIMERMGAYFEFWEHVGVARVESFDGHVEVGGMRIEPVMLQSRHRTLTHSTVYLITKGNKKLVYAPCDITPFPEDERFYGCKLMILQTGWWGERMAERARKGPHYEISMEEILAIINRYAPERVLLTHIGDELEMTLQDLAEFEEEHRELNIKFASDQMIIEV